jgi:hypothetical protein
MDYAYTFLVFPTEKLQKHYQDLSKKGAMCQFGNGYRNIDQKKISSTKGERRTRISECS